MWSADSKRERIQMVSDYNKIIKQHILNEKKTHFSIPLPAALQHTCNCSIAAYLELQQICSITVILTIYL